MIKVYDSLPYVNLAVYCDSVTLKVAPGIASALHSKKDTPLMSFSKFYFRCFGFSVERDAA